MHSKVGSLPKRLERISIVNSEIVLGSESIFVLDIAMTKDVVESAKYKLYFILH
jgi:hypothetical protein